MADQKPTKKKPAAKRGRAGTVKVRITEHKARACGMKFAEGAVALLPAEAAKELEALGKCEIIGVG